MFSIETTWQGKRNSHSWITCLSSSKEVAEAYAIAQVDPKATHRLFEISQNEFPVFFVGIQGGYRHVALHEIRELLATTLMGEPEEILFNIYRFSGEYRWSTQGYDQTANHIHVFNESLQQYREREGELAEVVGYAAST